MTSIEGIYIGTQNNDIRTQLALNSYYEGKKAFYLCLLINGSALIFFGSFIAIATVILTINCWIEISLIDCMYIIFLHSVLWVSAVFAIVCGILIFVANHSKGKSILIVTITAMLIAVILFGVTLVKGENRKGITLNALNRTYSNPNFDTAWTIYENQNDCCGVGELICKISSMNSSDSCFDIIIYKTESSNRKIRLFASLLLPSLISCSILGIVVMLCIPNIDMKAKRSIFRTCR